ncbi:hypothetical protein MAXJ12_33454 [Mesorhizobium alhagi CCNWXJ12-2]|uniref:Uncharacterized protein n=1 Tax=Mesorhizobium alhagi CCNWXJ12-2 TaxID=1107882 RepID=H0I2I7_9HYPH|nr:hypothetical protein MAXJ12_33454 [Mesorhizobium alhagi CCNWXJ12-2]
MELPDNAAFVAPAAYQHHQSANRQPAAGPFSVDFSLE